MRSTSGSGAAHRGPPLTLLAAVHVALFVAALVVLAGATRGSWPLPGADPDAVVRFLRRNPATLRLVGLLQFGAAVPLLLYAATASSRLRHLGIRAAGTTIALAGGTLAAAALAAAGALLAVAGATAEHLDAATAALLHRVTFVAGGTGHLVFLGLLLAGIAVTSLLARQLPQWLCWSMLVVALAAELSTLGLALDGANVLPPVARFAGMAGLVAAGVSLPTRTEVHA